MNKRYTVFVFVIAMAAFGSFFMGCYTQLSSSKSDEQNVDEGYSSKQNEDDQYGDDEYYDDDYQHRSRVGFSYYYPSYGSGFPSYSFSAAYNDPWSYGGYGYYGGYNSYGYNSYNPYYSYGYYSPYYSYYYPSYYYRYGYTYATPVRHRVRDFGSTRGGINNGSTTQGAGGYSSPPDRGTVSTGSGVLPTGASYDRSGVGAARGTGTPNVSTSRKREGSVRGSGSQSSSDQRGTRTGRGTGSRGRGYRDSNRDAQVGTVPSEGGRQTSPPSSYTPPKGNTNQREPSRGKQETSAPRSTPPPSSSGQSAPAPSRSSGSSRGKRP